MTWTNPTSGILCRSKSAERRQVERAHRHRDGGILRHLRVEVDTSAESDPAKLQIVPGDQLSVAMPINKTLSRATRYSRRDGICQ